MSMHISEESNFGGKGYNNIGMHTKAARSTHTNAEVS